MNTATLLRKLAHFDPLSALEESCVKLEFSKYYDYFLNYAYYETLYPGEALPFPD